MKNQNIKKLATIHFIIFHKFYNYEVYLSTSEDYNYIYRTKYFYLTKKPIDINNKEVIIE